MIKVFHGPQICSFSNSSKFMSICIPYIQTRPPPAYQCIHINITYHLISQPSPPFLHPHPPDPEEICQKKGRGQSCYTHSDLEGHSVLQHGRTPSFPSPLSPSPYLPHSLPFSPPPLTFPPSIELQMFL